MSSKRKKSSGSCRVNRGRKVDVEARNKKYPDTFKIASKSRRAGLKKGNYAKVIWECKRGGDRMWVKIAAVLKKRGKVAYVGELRNKRVKCGPCEGARVIFEPKHVADFSTRMRSG